VGSRDERLGNLWCSQVCCPYALRTAQAMKYKDPELDITVFYMDIQNTGNDFPVFYQQCKDEMKFVRNIPVDMYETEDDRIRTRFMAAEGSSEAWKTSSTWWCSPWASCRAADNAKLSETVGAPINDDGFFACADKLNRASDGPGGYFCRRHRIGTENHCRIHRPRRSICRRSDEISGEGLMTQQTQMETINLATDVLVVGAGMTGMKAATEIAANGYKVVLIDEGSGLAGVSQRCRRSGR
jgi:heterodisulfide reductase subunit A-like polyferredoxin